jgi:single-stranded-DNA-specific exonuclease
MLHEPMSLPGMAGATERLARAVRDGELIAIYGDYDVDGITASTILYHTLTSLGARVRTYIPHRIEEGYGLNSDAVARLCDEGARLLVTVDCGVTALGPAAVARERGVDVVITDHHEWKVGPAGEPVFPEAVAIVHPRLPGGGGTGGGQAYGNPHLCGAGVAFKLAWGVGQAIHGARVAETFKHLLVEMTALAALGTIADVVPLVGENRVIASFGLSCLPRSRIVGIEALISSAGLDGEKLDAFDVGFRLAPRLNAAGRMGHAELALEMLTTATADRAGEIAAYLEKQNRDRQETERRTLTEVMEEINRLGDDAESCAAILVGKRGWHPGVIGIVASRVVDRLHRPTVLVAVGEEGLGSGSGRSISGFHLARALGACGDLLESHGGHEMAAGLKVREDRLGDLRERFQQHARQVLSPEQLVPELKLECEAGLGQMTAKLVEELTRLGPFGHGNRRPVLACRGVEVTGTRRVGRTGEHLQLTLRQDGRVMKGIAFSRGDLADELRVGERVDLAVEPDLNEWNGRVSVEVLVKDVRRGADKT